MIDIKEIIDSEMICEGLSTPKYIFDDGNLTFADIRDILTKVFSGGLSISEQVDGLNLMITYKDGKFCVASTPKELRCPICMDRINAKYCKEDKAIQDCFMNSVKDLSIALSELDPIQLNKFFANGQNFMICKLIYPPCQNVLDYGNKCFIVLDKIVCYNDKFKEVGEDADSATALFDILRGNGALRQETFEITKPNIMKIKNLTSSKEVLDKILTKLNEFINGLGWKCSINGYIQDRYSRHIVNKALEHGLDVARNSDFVNELASRLSNVSGRKPTKSDLLTFAKREGINCKSQEYRDLIADLESNADQTNVDIVRPIEDLIAYAALMLMKNIEGYMSVDPSRTAVKALSNLDDAITSIQEGDIDLSPEKIVTFKKNLAKIENYHEMMPASGVMIRYKGKVYKLSPNFGDAHAILNLIKYK